jgi:hypothetical protein
LTFLSINITNNVIYVYIRSIMTAAVISIYFALTINIPKIGKTNNINIYDLKKNIKNRVSYACI